MRRWFQVSSNVKAWIIHHPVTHRFIRKKWCHLLICSYIPFYASCVYLVSYFGCIGSWQRRMHCILLIVLRWQCYSVSTSCFAPMGTSLLTFVCFVCFWAHYMSACKFSLPKRLHETFDVNNPRSCQKSQNSYCKWFMCFQKETRPDSVWERIRTRVLVHLYEYMLLTIYIFMCGTKRKTPASHPAVNVKMVV